MLIRNKTCAAFERFQSLGAAPGAVGAMVVREGVRLALAGIVVGLAGARVQVRFMQSLIFGLKAFDTATFVAVCSFMGLIAVLASYLPSRRAARIDPLEVLRSE